MIGKLYGLVHSVLTLCKRPLPAHGTRPDDESGVPISVWTATECPERARPGPARSRPVGTGALTLGLGPTSIRLPERGPAHRTHVSRDQREQRDKPEAKRG